MDAEHIIQACNDCDVFLRRGEESITNPHRDRLEKRFPKLRIMKPSERLVFLDSEANGFSERSEKRSLASIVAEKPKRGIG